MDGAAIALIRAEQITASIHQRLKHRGVRAAPDDGRYDFGKASDPTTALVYTEEPPESIREKVEHAGLQRAWIVYG